MSHRQLKLEAVLVTQDSNGVVPAPGQFTLEVVVIDLSQNTLLRLQGDATAVLETRGGTQRPLVLHLAQRSQGEENLVGSLSVLPELVPVSNVLLISVCSTQVQGKECLKNLAVQIDAAVSLSGGYVLKRSSSVVSFRPSFSSQDRGNVCECQVAQLVSHESGNWLLHRGSIGEHGMSLRDPRSVRVACDQVVALRDEIRTQGDWQCLPSEWWEARGLETLIVPGAGPKPNSTLRLHTNASSPSQPVTGNNSKKRDSVDNKGKGNSPEKTPEERFGELKQNGVVNGKASFSPPTRKEENGKFDLDGTLRKAMEAELTNMAQGGHETAAVTNGTHDKAQIEKWLAEGKEIAEIEDLQASVTAMSERRNHLEEQLAAVKRSSLNGNSDSHHGENGESKSVSTAKVLKANGEVNPNGSEPSSQVQHAQTAPQQAQTAHQRPLATRGKPIVRQRTSWVDEASPASSKHSEEVGNARDKDKKAETHVEQTSWMDEATDSDEESSDDEGSTEASPLPSGRRSSWWKEPAMKGDRKQSVMFNVMENGTNRLLQGGTLSAGSSDAGSDALPQEHSPRQDEEKVVNRNRPSRVSTALLSRSRSSDGSSTGRGSLSIKGEPDRLLEAKTATCAECCSDDSESEESNHEYESHHLRPTHRFQRYEAGRKHKHRESWLGCSCCSRNGRQTRSSEARLSQGTLATDEDVQPPSGRETIPRRESKRESNSSVLSSWMDN